MSRRTARGEAHPRLPVRDAVEACDARAWGDHSSTSATRIAWSVSMKARVACIGLNTNAIERRAHRNARAQRLSAAPQRYSPSRRCSPERHAHLSELHRAVDERASRGLALSKQTLSALAIG